MESSHPVIEGEDSLKAKPEAIKQSNLPNQGEMEDLAVSSGHGEWQSLASFTVEFQAQIIEEETAQRVTVYYQEGDKRQTWEDVEDESIYQWILEQANEGMVNEVVQPLIEAEQEEIPVSAIEITQLRVLQSQTGSLMLANKANRSLPDFIRSDEPFAVKVSFKLLGKEAVNLAQQGVSYRIQGEARNKITGVSIPLSDSQSGHLVAGKLVYTVGSSEITLLPGLYRLQIVATLQNALTPPAFLEIPILQVI